MFYSTVIKNKSVIRNKSGDIVTGFYIGDKFIAIDNASDINVFLSHLTSDEYERFRKEFCSELYFQSALPTFANGQLSQN